MVFVNVAAARKAGFKTVVDRGGNVSFKPTTREAFKAQAAIKAKQRGSNLIDVSGSGGSVFTTDKGFTFIKGTKPVKAKTTISQDEFRRILRGSETTTADVLQAATKRTISKKKAKLQVAPNQRAAKRIKPQKIEKFDTKTFSGRLEKASEQAELKSAAMRIRSGEVSFIRGATEATVGAFGLGAVRGVIGVKDVVTKPKQTVKGVVRLAKNPVKFVKLEAKRFGKDPAGVLGEWVAFTGALRVAGKGAKFAGVQATRISPKFKPITKGVVKIGKGLKEIDIKIVKGVKSTAEPLKTQAKLAGKKITAVTAAKDLIKPFQKKVKIRKKAPKGVELEKSLFADPRGRLRTSRLGLDSGSKATLKDIISGNVQVTLLPQRPQAIFFRNVRVEKLPKDIFNALKKGKPLTKNQQKRLLKQQLTPTGKFKPIGFLSVESEVTLAAGEIIRSLGVKAKTIINGKKVSFIEAEVVKASPKLKKLLAQKISGKITKANKKLLNKLIEKESKGLSKTISSSQVPVLNISGGISKAAIGVSKVSGVSKLSRIPISKVSPVKKPISKVSPVSRRRKAKSISPSSPTKRVSGVSGGSKISKISVISPIGRGSGVSGVSKITPLPPVKPPVKPIKLVKFDIKKVKKAAEQGKITPQQLKLTPTIVRPKGNKKLKIKLFTGAELRGGSF